MGKDGRSSWIDERGDVWLYIGGIPFFIMTADSIEESRAIAFGWDNGIIPMPSGPSSKIVD